jgi:hypothetical protein
MIFAVTDLNNDHIHRYLDSVIITLPTTTVFTLYSSLLVTKSIFFNLPFVSYYAISLV